MRLAWAGVRVSALRAVPVVLMVAGLTSGCSGLGTSSPGAAAGAGPIAVGVVPGIDNAPLRIASQDGLFQQSGLNITVKEYPSLGAEFQALLKGQIQVAGGDYTDFLYEQALGTRLRLLADEYDSAANSVAILTKPSSGITSPQQLQARRVATPPAELIPHVPASVIPYNIETLAAEEVLQNDGVSPSSVTWEPAPVQDLIGELKSGQVSAILVTEPYILQAEEQLGAVEVVNASGGVTSGLPVSGFFSLDAYARANPSAVQAFQVALDQAQSAGAQRGQVEAVLPQLTGMTAGNASLITLGTYPTSLNIGQVQRVASLMYDAGMITSPISVSSTLTSG